MNAKIAVLKKIIVGFLVMVIGSGPYGYTMKRKRDEVSGQESSKRPRVTAPQASSSSQVGGQYVLGVRRVYALQEQFPRVRVFNKYLGMKHDPRIQKMLAGTEEEEKEEEEETDKE